jgi:hypothetical protein
MGNLEKYALVGIVGAIIAYFLATRQQPVPVGIQQVVQPTETQETTTITTTPIPYESAEPTITPEEPVEYGTPEESGAGGYTPIVMSNNDCFMSCLSAGYLNGSCMWPSEAPGTAAKIIDCLIEGSRHCGNIGQCGCYCWGTYEGG